MVVYGVLVRCLDSKEFVIFFRFFSLRWVRCGVVVRMGLRLELESDV